MTTTAVTFVLPEIWMELKDHTLLAELMSEQNKSARHMARIAGWRSHTYMQRILKGIAKNIETEPAARIAHELGVPFGLLFRTRVSGNTAQSVRERKSA